MRRLPLRLAAVLLLTLEIAVALASGCATTTTSHPDPEACPNVFCSSEDGHKQCTAAGCNCTGDFCVREGPPVPRPTCPLVSCQSSAGYNQCVAAGCACSPTSNGCLPVAKAPVPKE